MKVGDRVKLVRLPTKFPRRDRIGMIGTIISTAGYPNGNLVPVKLDGKGGYCVFFENELEVVSKMSNGGIPNVD